MRRHDPSQLFLSGSKGAFKPSSSRLCINDTSRRRPHVSARAVEKNNLYFEACAGGTALLFLEKRASFDFTKMVRREGEVEADRQWGKQRDNIEDVLSERDINRVKEGKVAQT